MNHVCVHIFCAVSVILICIKPVPAYADSVYTLDELIKRSLSRYELLRASRHRITGQKYAAKQASELMNPEVSLSGGSKRTPGTHGYLYGIELNQHFYFPGKQALRREIAEYGIRISELEHSEMQLFIRYEVTRLAYAYASLLEHSTHVKHRLRRLRLIDSYLTGRKIIAPQKRVERDIIRLKVGMLERAAAENSVKMRTAFDRLNVYICTESEGAPPAVDIEWYRDIPEIDPAAIKGKAIRDNLLLQRYRAQVRMNRAGERLSRREAFPDPGISLFYTEEHAGTTERSFGGGFTVAIPVLNRNRNAVMISRARTKEKKNELIYSERSLVNELNLLIKKYQAASMLVRDLPVSYADILEQKMRYADREFRKGRVDLQTYLEIDSMAYESLEAIYRAQVQLVDAHTQILFLTADRKGAGNK